MNLEIMFSYLVIAIGLGLSQSAFSSRPRISIINIAILFSALFFGFLPLLAYSLGQIQTGRADNGSVLLAYATILAYIISLWAVGIGLRVNPRKARGEFPFWSTSKRVRLSRLPIFEMLPKPKKTSGP